MKTTTREEDLREAQSHVSSALSRARLSASHGMPTTVLSELSAMKWAVTAIAQIPLPEREIKETLDELCQRIGGNLEKGLEFLDGAAGQYKLPMPIDDYTARVQQNLQAGLPAFLRHTRRAAKRAWKGEVAGKVLGDIQMLNNAASYGVKLPEGEREIIIRITHQRGVEFARQLMSNHRQQGSRSYQHLQSSSETVERALAKYL